MLVKDLISAFSTDTFYTILYSDNPHYKVWWGKGNNCNTTCNEKTVLNIQWTKKGIIIYI